MPQNAFFLQTHDLVSKKMTQRHFFSTLHPLSIVIFATATVLAFVLLRDSRFNFHCYTQRESTPSQKSARKCAATSRDVLRKRLQSVFTLANQLCWIAQYNCKTVLFWEDISRQKHDSMRLRLRALSENKEPFHSDQDWSMSGHVSWFDLRVILSHTHSHNELYTRDVNNINTITVLTLSRSSKWKGLNFGLRGEAKKRTYTHSHTCMHAHERKT